MGIAKNDKGLEEIKTFFSPAIVGIVLINMGSGNEMWGFHFKSLPKVCRTKMNPGVKSSFLL